jgi:two-component system chemotaxis response regulator CheB
VRLLPTSDYPRNFYIPSVDLMLSSLAEAAGGPVLGVILTGMGNDGLKGMLQLKSRGGITLVQDESTSTIFGMPRACIEGGAADEILPLGQIGPAIGQLTGG